MRGQVACASGADSRAMRELVEKIEAAMTADNFFKSFFEDDEFVHRLHTTLGHKNVQLGPWNRALDKERRRMMRYQMDGSDNDIVARILGNPSEIKQNQFVKLEEDRILLQCKTLFEDASDVSITEEYIVEEVDAMVTCKIHIVVEYEMSFFKDMIELYLHDTFQAQVAMLMQLMEERVRVEPLPQVYEIDVEDSEGSEDFFEVNDKDHPEMDTSLTFPAELDQLRKMVENVQVRLAKMEMSSEGEGEEASAREVELLVDRLAALAEKQRQDAERENQRQVEWQARLEGLEHKLLRLKSASLRRSSFSWFGASMLVALLFAWPFANKGFYYTTTSLLTSGLIALERLGLPKLLSLPAMSFEMIPKLLKPSNAL